jgi:autotransporter-associated beta strand protein
LDSAGHNNGVINNGGGIWSKVSADPNWTTDGGTTNSIWNDGDDAIFGGNPGVGAAGTITLSGTRTAGSLTFNAPASGNFTIASTGSDMISLSALNTTITQNAANAVTISAPIEGNDTTLTLTNGVAGTGIVTISGAISEKNSHPLALTKTGSSNFVLSSASSNYTGATNINGGTLTVNGTIAGGGAFNINTGGKLAGTGTVTKSVSLNSGGTLSPGGDGSNATVGAITTNGGGPNSHAWAGSSTYLWEIKDATAAAGTGYDTLNVTGTLTVNATSASKMTIKVVSHGAVTNWNPGQVWNWDITTATTTSGFSADKFVLDVTDFIDDNSADPANFQVTQLGTHIRVSYVPEPGSMLLAGTGLGALFLRRRRG